MASSLSRHRAKRLAALREAARLSALSDGAFDIIVQPLWDLARQDRNRAPALPLIGWRRISADASGVILRPGMAVTLNGIAQGRARTLGLRDPRRADGYAGALELDGRCVATSGDHASVFSADFSHHHIFDRATGGSPAELAAGIEGVDLLAQRRAALAAVAGIGVCIAVRL